MSYLSCSHSGVTRLDACDMAVAEAKTVREYFPFLDVVSAVRFNILHLAEPMQLCLCSSRGPPAALYPPNPCEYAPQYFMGDVEESRPSSERQMRLTRIVGAMDRANAPKDLLRTMPDLARPTAACIFSALRSYG